METTERKSMTDGDGTLEVLGALTEAVRALRLGMETTLAGFAQIHREMAELRDLMVEMDHAKASRAQLRELGGRVDVTASLAAALDDYRKASAS